MDALNFAADSPVLDTTVLTDLSSIDADIVTDLVQAFVSDVPVRIDTLRVGVEARSAAAILREAHGLKGSAFAVGAVRMAALCAAIEDDAHAGRFDEAAARWGCLGSEFVEVRQALEAMC